ncbi:MAG: 1-acyl-sn-glycerol-3-phosphate acyltransferase [Myxococcales bacterium]|nr:1-acyl-sn-glycerol-3-phosphate acyltransferase [Myxococcales bacterium]
MRKAHREKVKSEVTGRIIDRHTKRAASGGRPIEETVNESLYHERERLKTSHTDRDVADRQFYASIRRTLPHASPSQCKQLFASIVQRYTDQVTGRFNPTVYKLATSVLPFGLSALLNSLSPKRLLSRLQDVPTLDDHVNVQGEVDTLRRLQKQGTVIVAPTHSSNLDSVLMGYTIYRMGLPPVTYGAGLNLFSNKIIGFFMHNLGAYTVDRMKSDPLYREVLKEYATVTMEYGQDQLFFPGGTRSRSGAVEAKLKRGLLGTSIGAYRNNLINRRPNPRIFVFPVTISYPLVLEGATLIDDYLQRAGRSRYIIVDDEFSRLERWIEFMRGLFSLDLQISITVGKPLDPFGNDVGEDGESLDPRGRPIDPSRYLLIDGEYAEDDARDHEYTSALSSRLVDAYHRDNVALAEHVLAFAFFETLRRESQERDIYRLLRSLDSETSLALPRVAEEIERLLGELSTMERRGQIRVSSMVSRGDVDEIIHQGLLSFATYHTRPVIERRGVRLHVGDANLILFYRNRLDGYRLLDAPNVVSNEWRPAV